MTLLMKEKPSSRPVTADSVLDYLKREASKAFAGLIKRVNQLLKRSEHVYLVPEPSGFELDFTDNDTVIVTLHGDTSLIFTDPENTTSALLRVLIHGGATYTVSWPGSVVWGGGVPPTLQNPSQLVLLLYYEGSYYGPA
jgi:hypothetical protein